MTGNHYVDLALAIQGLISAIATLVALFTPKSSMLGAFAARVGVDMKKKVESDLPTPKDGSPAE